MDVERPIVPTDICLSGFAYHHFALVAEMIHAAGCQIRKVIRCSGQLCWRACLLFSFQL